MNSTRCDNFAKPIGDSRCNASRGRNVVKLTMKDRVLNRESRSPKAIEPDPVRRAPGPLDSEVFEKADGSTICQHTIGRDLTHSLKLCQAMVSLSFSLVRLNASLWRAMSEYRAAAPCRAEEEDEDLLERRPREATCTRAPRGIHGLAVGS